jgi:hypothetical protein
MRAKWLLSVLGFAALCTTGCATSYQVYVNGYAEAGAPPKENSPIYVAENPDASNPILDRRIKAKLEDLLRDRGYKVALTADEAEYKLAYQVGVRPETFTGYVPTYEHVEGNYGPYGPALGFGYTTSVPYMDTYFNHWLTLRLYQIRPNQTAEGQIVWIGEATTLTEQRDIREAIDYLLVACFDEFGSDTHGQVRIPIRRNDPRVQEMRAGP